MQIVNLIFRIYMSGTDMFDSDSQKWQGNSIKIHVSCMTYFIFRFGKSRDDPRKQRDLVYGSFTILCDDDINWK